VRIVSKKFDVPGGKKVVFNPRRAASEKPKKPDPMGPPPPGHQAFINLILDQLKSGNGGFPSESEFLMNIIAPLGVQETSQQPSQPHFEIVWRNLWPKKLRETYRALSQGTPAEKQKLVNQIFSQLGLVEEGPGPGKPCDLSKIFASLPPMNRFEMLNDLETILKFCGNNGAAKILGEARERLFSDESCRANPSSN